MNEDLIKSQTKLVIFAKLCMIHIMKTQKYSQEIEVKMRAFYESLSEKDSRRYAAVEAEKSCYGEPVIYENCLTAIIVPFYMADKI